MKPSMLNRFSILTKWRLALLAIAMAGLWYLATPAVLSSEEQLLWDRVRAAQLHMTHWRESKDSATPLEYDPWQCGLIGVEWSMTTTTLGDLAAKRTACNPVWAIQFYRWFSDLQLKPGDNIAIFSSASFPGLLLSAISGAEAMELNPLLVVSLGASTWGANEPDNLWPVLAREIRRGGFISKQADYYTMGGEAESGLGLSLEAKTLLRKVADDSNIELLITDNLQDMISRKAQLLEMHQPGLFINIGGSHANMGDDDQILKLSPGLITGNNKTKAGNGVIGFAIENDIPVIHMLNIKAISNKAGISYDSPPRKIAPNKVSSLWSILGVVLFVTVMWTHRRWVLESATD